MAKVEEEFYSLYNGDIKLRFLPNSHRYSIDGDQKIGVTTITGVINKESLMLWPLDEAMKYLQAKLVDNRDPEQTALYSANELEHMLKEAAVAFRAKQTRGTDAGTAAHAWLEDWLKCWRDNKELPEYPYFQTVSPADTTDERIRKEDHNHLIDALRAFTVWVNGNNIEVLEVERPIYSIKYDYCGTLDAILGINGKTYVIDFKTSNPSREFSQGIYPENFAQLGGYDIAYSEEFPNVKIDGHGIINLSKKTGSLSTKFLDGVERQSDRDFFIYCLGTKRGMQNRTRLLSNKYQDKEKK